MHKVYRRVCCLFCSTILFFIITIFQPIPLELLLVVAPDEISPARGANNRSHRALTKRNSFTRNAPPAPPKFDLVKGNSKDGYSIMFVHLGRKNYQVTLWASTQVNRRKWLEVIHKQQDIMRERSMVFDTLTISEGFFSGPNKVLCAAPFGVLYKVSLMNLQCLIYFLQNKERRLPMVQRTAFISKILRIRSETRTECLGWQTSRRLMC